jgi:hypothetical protein
MRPLAWIVLLAVAACSAPSADSRASADLAAVEEGVAVDLHDVAVLFPLPASGNDGLWPASRDLGDGRALVPSDVVDRLGDIVEGDSNATTYASLRVVSLRLEPCFVAAGASSDACERQLRFVLQPVIVDPSGALPTTTLDAAVHVIYALPAPAFSELVRGIVAARLAQPSPARAPAPAPLGVHPVLAAEGFAGPFAHALEQRVLSATAKGRLVRVTFMGVRGRGNEWQLGGVQIGGEGAIAALPIPASGARLQSIVLQRGAQTFVKSVSPQTAGTDDVSLLFDSLSASAASHDDIAAALHAANRIENPDVRTSEDTDSAPAHTIASSRLWAEKTFAQHEETDRYAAAGFALGAPSALNADLGVLRAFGYFGSEAVVSPRAANDTARAAQRIRTGSRGPR